VPSALRGEVIALDALAARLNEGHPLARDEHRIGLKDLAGSTLVVPPSSLAPGAHDHLIACCRASGFEPRTVTAPLLVPPAMRGVATALHARSFALVPEPLGACDGTVARRLRDAPLAPLVLAWCPEAMRQAVETVADAVRRIAGPAQAPARSRSH
jgi:hypothetical protein